MTNETAEKLLKQIRDIDPYTYDDDEDDSALDMIKNHPEVIIKSLLDIIDDLQR